MATKSGIEFKSQIGESVIGVQESSVKRGLLYLLVDEENVATLTAADARRLAGILGEMADMAERPARSAPLGEGGRRCPSTIPGSLEGVKHRCRLEAGHKGHCWAGGQVYFAGNGM